MEAIRLGLVGSGGMVDLARATGKVLRTAHPEVVSAEHRQLKASALGWVRRWLRQRGGESR